MINQQRKNRITIISLFSLTVIPFCIAWYLSAHPDLIGSSKVSNGELIIPVVSTEKNEFIGFDAFSAANLTQLSGHWLIANVIPSNECEQTCKEAIYKSKQLHLMLSKDLTRVRRVVLLLQPPEEARTREWWANDTRLLKIKTADSLTQKLQQIRKGKMAEGMLFLIDPLGNIMMQYQPGFDPYKVEKDLKKLLNISQIG